MRLEVRCCCQPQKLLGWIDVPDRQVVMGQALRLPYRRPIYEGISPTAAMPPRMTSAADEVVTHLQLYVGRIASPERPRGYLAVKAEGVPIETLRQIVGFKEAAPRPAG